jgi:hypothetical protein
MKIYRLHLWDGRGGESIGYRYFPSMKAAVRVYRDYHGRGEIKTIEFTPTLSGILKVLNIYGSHPNNG